MAEGQQGAGDGGEHWEAIDCREFGRGEADFGAFAEYV